MASAFCPHPQLGGGPQRDDRKRGVGGIDLDDGQVIGGIDANHLGFELALLGQQRHFQESSLFDHVVVGQNVSLGVDDGSGTGSLLGDGAEEEVKAESGGGDVDHARTDPPVDLDIFRFVLAEGGRWRRGRHYAGRLAGMGGRRQVHRGQAPQPPGDGGGQGQQKHQRRQTKGQLHGVENLQSAPAATFLTRGA